MAKKVEIKDVDAEVTVRVSEEFFREHHDNEHKKLDRRIKRLEGDVKSLRYRLEGGGDS